MPYEEVLLIIPKCSSPHATQGIIKVNHMPHTIQRKFLILHLQKCKLEHCIPMCGPSPIIGSNDSFTEGTN